MDSDEEISRIYHVLSNPVRQRIIEFLGSKGKAGVMEIKRALKMSTGSLYYNLDLLGDLIDRDLDRKYVLSEKGWIAFNLLKNGKESVVDARYYTGHFISFRLRSRLSMIFHPRWFFFALSDYKFFSLFLPLMVLLLGGWVCYSTNVELTLFSYSFKPMIPSLYLAGRFVCSWFLIFALAELLPFLFHGRVGGHLNLFFGLGIATLPLLGIPFLAVYGVDGFFVNSLLIFLLQFFSCLLLSTAIGVAKDIGVERSLLLGFLIVYLNITFMIVFRG